MIFNILHILWLAFQIVIGYNLVLPILLYIIYVITPKKKKDTNQVNPKEADYAIIVTAYEQTHTLPPVIASLLKLDYNNFIIYIVADKCDVSNLYFDDDRVVVLRPPETLASNTRSHFYAIHHFKRNH